MTGKFYCRGRDIDGNLLVHVRVSNIYRGRYKSIDVVVRTVVFAIEWLCGGGALMNPMDAITLLIDTREMTMSNVDEAFITAILQVVESYYPGFIRKVIVVPTTSIVALAWRGLKVSLSR